MRVDVSSHIKCRREGNGLDVITQDCCYRQEFGGGEGWWVVTENKQGCLSDRNDGSCLTSQRGVYLNKLFQPFNTTQGGELSLHEGNLN